MALVFQNAADEWDFLLQSLMESARENLPNDPAGQLAAALDQLRSGPSMWPFTVTHVGVILRWGRVLKSGSNPWIRSTNHA
jgi:hypothetical protein